MQVTNLEHQRHTLSHIMAQAVLNLFPGTKLGIGPAIENGFYYDFEMAEPIKDEDIPKIEKEMQKIIKAGEPMVQTMVKRTQALRMFPKMKQPYKRELLDEIPDEEVSIFRIGDEGFNDLCRGPHVESTGRVGAFKLMNIAGAYWRGDEKNPMLQRIYGIAFNTQKELDNYIAQVEEAKKRDHRKIGRELKLFMTDEKVGAGLIMWLPRGAFMRKQIMDFAFETYLENGYQPVSTPHIANLNLWKTSGHWDFYRDSMYDAFGVDEEQYTLKPMNCPFHITMYNSEKHSYRDLPVRYTEMGTVYRYEKAGELGGLTRVRGFTQDDAHIICTADQLNNELNNALELTFFIMKRFGFEKYEMHLSTHDPKNTQKYIGDMELWADIEEKLRDVIKKRGYPIVEDPGEAAFYGPKIDLKAEDVMGRKHQLTTIQVDFNLPDRFNMTYTAADGTEQCPFMIHRALLGSLERFMGILIEHYGGKFPLWLCYEQVRIVPINDVMVVYAEKVRDELKKMGFRSKVDDRSESMQKKIRDAEIEKIPYMLIVGEKERSTSTVSVRSLDEKDKGLMSLEEFGNMLKAEI